MDMKLEVVPVPVRDVDAAKDFYTRQVGFPGSVKGVQLVVEDLDAVRSDLAGRGVGISGVQQLGPEGTPGSRYCFFDDPDGNTWAVQEYKRT
jgi:catechol 2,3-dioxygenase-like lactoylglutathione lyase family enzyme